jgi:putative DNA primase/helicase
MTPPTPETICAALAFIPPNLPRDEWARVAMALKSELGDAGFDLFDEWSKGGESYKGKSTRGTWQSVKAGGAVGIGTLFHLAAQHGYKPSEAAAAPKPTPEEVQAAAKAKAESIARDIAERDARQRDASAQAAQLWAQASEQGESRYLQRKGVRGHGVRYGPGGVLLVPMRDAAGELWNVQTIKPEKPADDAPEKLFLKGGRKSGLWHWIGKPEGASVLLIAEGLATASSVHEATGRPVAVAFDAGNLAPVAKAIRKAYPAALIVMAADNDTATEAKTGTNPGRVKATEAAHAVRGIVACPEADALPTGGSDFNDLHLHAGLDAVRERIEAAITEGPPSARGAKGRPTPSPKRNDAPAAQGAGTPGDSADDDPARFDPFTVNDGGVWFQGFDAQGRPRPPTRICSRLEVVAKTRFADSGGWGYLVQFADDEGHPKELAIARDALQGDGVEVRKRLSHLGLYIEPERHAREKLAKYIGSRRVEAYARAVDRAGWHGKVYVLPRRVIGNADERFIIQADGAQDHPFASRGTAQQWRDHVGRLCVGNSRLAFGVAAAFASALVRLVESVQSGGFLFKGPSSRGKTKVLLAAGSVFGSHAMCHTWDSTKVGGEVLAAMSSDSPLILDELKHGDPRAVADMVYMIANGVGRSRGNASMKLRPSLSWKLLFLAAGEVTLEQHMASVGLKPAEGQDIRMPTIPAEPDGTVGSMFETTHEFQDGNEFAGHIERATARYHGVVGIEFIEWVAERFDEVRRRLPAAIKVFTDAHVTPGSDGQLYRVATRFALVAVGGELATEAGLTGWPEGEATRAALACFKSWLAQRPGGEGSGERARMLTHARLWFQMNDARFGWVHRALDDRAPDKGLQAGFKRLVSPKGKAVHFDSDHMSEYGEKLEPHDAKDAKTEYLVYIEVFEKEVCAGFDALAMKRLLADDLGYLIVEVSKDRGGKEVRRFATRVRLPVGFGGEHASFYRFNSKIRADVAE